MSRLQALTEARILIVDDDMVIIRLLEYFLKNSGFSQVKGITDPCQALAVYQDFKADLIVLDIDMPKKNGFEVMDELREIVTEPYLPVIILSSAKDRSTHIKALQKGARDFIEKPFDQTEAILRIKNILELMALNKNMNEQCKKMEVEVDKRTKDLKTSNEMLRNEISERLAAEARLTESNEKYQFLVQTIPDIIYQVDTKGRFVFISDSVERILGYSASELVGQHFSMIIHPDDIKVVSRSFVLENLKGFETGDEYSPKLFDERRSEKRMTRGLKVRLIPKKEQGSPVTETEQAYIYAEVDAFGFYEDKAHPDNFLGTSGIIRDITKRKKLEAQLRHAQKLEAIGTLAGGIAHDFNNILTSIIGYSELLKSETPEGTLAHSNLDEVLKAGFRAKDLVGQILTFSRKTQTERIPIQVDLIVKEALKFLRPTLPSFIKIHEAIRSSGSILADPTQIHQVIMNLCTNAYHAIQGGDGLLEVALTEEILDTKAAAFCGDISPGAYLKLLVKDNGDGMEKSVLDRIFEPYFTTKDHGRGSGLGLSVVHGIVKSHGGGINVTSSPGKGTAFHVYFPVVKKEEEEKKGEPDHFIPRGTERILFVDDDTIIVRMVKRMLCGMGYHVTAMSDSSKALELFRARPGAFDLIITDMTMPGMTGDELLLKIMEIRPETPTIICTGYSEKIDQKGAMEAGIRGYIQKPLSMLKVAETIREVLDASH